MASVTVGDGSTCLFWPDTWHGDSYSAQWPHLFSYAKEEHILVKDFMAAEDKSDFFHIPSQWKLMLNFSFYFMN